MFVHDFAYVDAPASVVQIRLLSAAFDGLDRAATEAYAEGEQLMARIGPFGDVPGLATLVSIRLYQPHRRGDVLVVPLTWTATGKPCLFPTLHGDLEVAPIDGNRTQLSLLGNYTPPLGQVGVTLDRLVMHRIAEATVRSLLRRLAVELAPAAAELPASDPLPNAG